MDSFFSLIFENFFIVIIIIVAIVNILSKAKGESQSTTRTEQPNDNQKQRKTIQDVFEEKIEQAKDSYQQAKDTLTDEAETQAETIEEQRQKQYNQLKERIQTEQPMKTEEKEYQKQFEKRIGLAKESQNEASEKVITNHALLQKKLTKQGLAESIVMAEVLGPPRALNPYQNVAMKRMQK